MIVLLGRLEKAHIVVNTIAAIVGGWVAISAERRATRDREKDDKIRILEIHVSKLERERASKRRK